MALKSMSISKLVALKDQVEAALSSKVLEQRRALESELSKLGRFQAGKSTSKAARGLGAVAPKYRNPENPAETWAGRGLKPRWLDRGDQVRQEVEEFLIPGSAASKANGRKKANSATMKARRAKTSCLPNLRLSDHAAARWANSPQPEEKGTVLCGGVEGQGLDESLVPPPKALLWAGTWKCARGPSRQYRQINSPHKQAQRAVSKRREP